MQLGLGQKGGCQLGWWLSWWLMRSGPGTARARHICQGTTFGVNTQVVAAQAATWGAVKALFD